MKKNIVNTLTLHLISDSTGETLKAVSAAAAAQFLEIEYQQKIYPMVRTVTQLERVFKNIRDEKGVVFCTLVEEEIREKLEKFCKKEKILYLPVMENIVSVGEGYAGYVITRSTLNRNGLFITSGLYDSGYHGVMAGCLHVRVGPAKIKKGTRVGQFILFEAETLSMYDGSYGIGKQHDNKYGEISGNKH